MNKIILSIYLPATQSTYDVKVDNTEYLYQVIDLISNGLEQISKGMYISSERPVLCNRDTGEIFNINMTLWQLGLKTGSKVMMI